MTLGQPRLWSLAEVTCNEALGVRRAFNAVHVQGWASLWVWWQNALALVPAVCAG